MGDICRILCSTINRSMCTLYWNKNISIFWIYGDFITKLNLVLLLVHPLQCKTHVTKQIVGMELVQNRLQWWFLLLSVLTYYQIIAEKLVHSAWALSLAICPTLPINHSQNQNIANYKFRCSAGSICRAFYCSNYLSPALCKNSTIN